jgi:hypothetical protein
VVHPQLPPRHLLQGGCWHPLPHPLPPSPLFAHHLQLLHLPLLVRFQLQQALHLLLRRQLALQALLLLQLPLALLLPLLALPLSLTP